MANSGSIPLRSLPSCRGRLAQNRSLSDLTWLRAGGPAEWLFQPADIADLSRFLAELDAEIPVFVMGVGSNLIVRDGGIPGVVIRLGRAFSTVTFGKRTAAAGAAALDSRVATMAAQAGLDLVFLRTIPGTVGGAVRMNAGCYGRYVADVCREFTMVTRTGQIHKVTAAEAGFGYRRSGLPPGCVIVEAVFDCMEASPETLQRQITVQLRHRNATQPTRIRTAGSAFRNPAGYSSTAQPGDDHSLKAWKLIDEAGMRGRTLGGAAVSAKHPNFLVNLGGATATDIEALGEEVRSRVLQHSGIELKWEIIRIGARASAKSAPPV